MTIRSIEIRPATLRDVTFIAAGMRSQDWQEIHASSPCNDKTEAGALCFLMSKWSYTAWLKGEPVCAFGFAMTGLPWIMSAWAFGTERMRRVIPAVTRHEATMLPLFAEAGIHRIEVRSLEGHDLAHGWLASLGAKRECDLPQYGRNGETFVLYAWTKD